MRHTLLTLVLIGSTGWLAGCEALGIETAQQVLARKEAEARAIGSACRHAVRSIEDCFNSNPKAGKAAIFAGWKDMDQYMRENEIVGMPGEGAAHGDEPAIIEEDERPTGNTPGEHARRS
ncbi:MAG: hypothetical protein R3E94_07090 [Burkholderiaceae bacterium]